MNEIQVLGVLPDPLGNPIAKADIRITAIKSVEGGTVASAYAHYYTNTAGVYNFPLLYGSYEIEVNVTDEYKIVTTVEIDIATPTPISLDELARYSAPVTPIVVNPNDPDWAAKYTALRTGNETTKRELLTQLRDGNRYTSDAKQLFINDELGSTISEEVQSVTSNLGAVTSIKNAYSDAENNNSTIDRVTLTTPNAKAEHTLEVTEASNGNTTYYQGNTYSVDGFAIEDLTTHTGDTLSLIKKALVDASYVISSQELTTGATGQVITNTQGVSLDTEGVLLTSSHIETVDSTGKGDTSLTDSVSLSIGGLSGNVYNTQELHVTDDNELMASMAKGITVYSKEAFDSITNDGFTAIRTVQADTTVFQGTDGEELAVFDAVANTLTVKGKLIVTNPDDFKGDTGDSYYQEYTYSINNGDPDWHSVFDAATDNWRRQRDVINNVPSVWSEGYLLRAIDGAAGDTYYIEYNYAPTNSGPWHETMVNGDIWRRERKWEGNPATPTETWSSPARIKGFDGEEGWISEIVYQYAINATDADALWHSNFITGDHWRREKVLTYYTQAAYAAGMPDIDPGFWNNTTQIVPIAGIDYGRKQSTIFIYIRTPSKEDVPPLPSGDLVWNFDDLTLTPLENLNGWSTAIPDGEGQLWIGLSVATSLSSTDTLVSSEWDIAIWSASGSTLARPTLYCVTASDVTPTLTFTNVEFDLVSNIGTVQGDNTYNWASVIPNNLVAGGRLWVTTDAKLVSGGTLVTQHPVADWAPPAVLSQNGIDGAPGEAGEPGLHGQGSYIVNLGVNATTPNDAAKDAYILALSGRSAQYGDVISFIFGVATDTNARREDYIRKEGAWEGFVSIVDGNQIIYGTLVAEHIQAATFTGDEFNAAFTLTAGTGNNVGVMSGTGAHRIWAGAASAEDAPFSVTQEGAVLMTNATIRGGAFELVGTSYLKYMSSSVFGPHDLVEWYGPKVNNVTWDTSLLRPIPAGMTKGNATTYLDSEGKAYFGGGIAAGDYRNALTTTENSPTATSPSLIFGSNGGLIDIVLTGNFSGSLYKTNDLTPVGSGSSSFTIFLEKKVNASWVIVATLTGDGRWKVEAEAGDRVGLVYCNGSLTYTDSTQSTAQREYRARMTTRYSGSVPVNNQEISIVTAEFNT